MATTSTVVPELVMALVNLWFTLWRLNRLEDMVGRQYDLADRQTTLAETLYDLHKALRAKDETFFGIVSSSPEYTQRYDCVVSRSNVNTVRKLIGDRQAGINSTSAYQVGQRRRMINLTAGALVGSSAPKALDAYKLEDAHADIALNRRHTNLVNSISTRFFSPAGVYASLGNYYAHMTGALSEQGTAGINSMLHNLGAAYESQVQRHETHKQLRSTDDFSRLEPGQAERVPKEVQRSMSALTGVQPASLTRSEQIEPNQVLVSDQSFRGV